ncbi:MarR family transcriptional regulator [Cohnella lubricantis]|uniref:MarR family transcriptional regulator n=1 Tax=Cohnella lubricantis TaxID=2163172 RepID=A0A841T5E0_9BACL|nr:MarR family transcriptional regulator [Cohnella lubricantis]MBB6676082.1 MarR family transcriptional regulator [Cohnella lubricantis]MBP2118037.1 DNA-binding MarR family transcriptional regulator [Cohnella lubricantis]
MSDRSERDVLIQRMLELSAEMQRKFQAVDDEEHRWLIDHCETQAAGKVLRDMSVMMLDIVDAVGKLQPVNGITISKRFGIPKGSVSKQTRRLVDMQVLQTQLHPGNKKEIYFSLTEVGDEIYRLHEALHRQIYIGARKFLERYSNEELRFLADCYQDTLQASWLQTEEPVSKATSAVSDRGDLQEIQDMLKSIDAAQLRQVKAILKVMFFTSFEEDRDD